MKGLELSSCDLFVHIPFARNDEFSSHACRIRVRLRIVRDLSPTTESLFSASDRVAQESHKTATMVFPIAANAVRRRAGTIAKQQIQKRYMAGGHGPAPEWEGIDKVVRGVFPHDYQCAL